MVNIHGSINDKYCLINVLGNKYHRIMSKNFIDSIENKIGKNNVNIISVDLNCISENMFSNPLRFAKSLIKLNLRFLKNIYDFKIKRTIYYFYFNPFILHFKDIKEIINLLKLKEIDNNYSYLNIHLGDLINDSLQRFTWGDFYLFRLISKTFLIIYSFIIFRQSLYFKKQLSFENILYLAASLVIQIMEFHLE